MLCFKFTYLYDLLICSQALEEVKQISPDPNEPKGISGYIKWVIESCSVYKKVVYMSGH